MRNKDEYTMVELLRQEMEDFGVRGALLHDAYTSPLIFKQDAPPERPDPIPTDNEEGDALPDVSPEQDAELTRMVERIRHIKQEEIERLNGIRADQYGDFGVALDIDLSGPGELKRIPREPIDVDDFIPWTRFLSLERDGKWKSTGPPITECAKPYGMQAGQFLNVPGCDNVDYKALFQGVLKYSIVDAYKRCQRTNHCQLPLVYVERASWGCARRNPPFAWCYILMRVVCVGT